MNWTALRKAASSSKVLIFLVFATTITVARWQGWVEQAWWQSTMENAYYLLIAGYSVVEIARAIATGRATVAKVFEDPKQAMDDVKDKADEQ